MSGGIRVISIYADRLVKRGHTVNIVTQPRKQLTFRAKLKQFLKGQGWPKKMLEEASHLDGLGLSIHCIESHRPVVDKDVPDGDVAIATFWRTGQWVANMSASKGAKAIFLQGYEASPGHEDPYMDSVWRMPLRKIVISKWLIDLAGEKFGDFNALHVPNSVDILQFNAPERGKQLVPTIGFLYSTVHLKGVDTILAALKNVRDRIPGLRVIAFGAHPVAPELPLPGYVEFHLLPSQQLIPKLYAACDVWVCGSRREGYHLPPLEAMACRCPVVSTKVGGPLDNIIDGVNGYLVDVDDFEALAARIIDVLLLPEPIWRRMSDAALESATRYSWDDATDRFEMALHEIVGEAKLVN